jgi:proline iminopeptidase
MRESFVQTSNGKIWYAVYGEDQPATPLLVIHGGPGFLSMPQEIDALADERPVYFYDQLGSGRSDRATNPNDYSVQSFINELDEVLNELKLPQIILMGFSWGCGLISAYMLQQKPQMIKALILSAPFLSTPMWDKDQRDNIARMPLDVIRAIEKGESEGDFGDDYQNAMMEYYKRHLCCQDPWPNSMQESFGQLNMDVYLTMWGPSEFTVSGKLKDFDLYPELHNITVPVLLTCGDRDEAGVKTVKDFQLAFPNAQMAVIPGTAHLHQIEKPELYRAMVRDFLRTL